MRLCEGLLMAIRRPRRDLGSETAVIELGCNPRSRLIISPKTTMAPALLNGSVTIQSLAVERSEGSRTLCRLSRLIKRPVKSERSTMVDTSHYDSPAAGDARPHQGANKVIRRQGGS